ncbi:MAG TPA: hypothetical protein VFO65_09100 [Acidimicrobiales bacterium]|nr:hypothetical protein [Acidimicrobiales bacterium]
MRRNLWIAVAAGLAGITLGAGAGVVAGAAVDDDAATMRPMMSMSGMVAMGDYESTDAMHAAMRGSMPAEVAARCDEMHAAMPEEMRSMAPGAMGDMGSMGSMLNGMGGGDAGSMADRHAEHHR